MRLALALFLVTTVSWAQAGSLDRPEDPLVLTGAQLGRLLNIPPDDLVAFSYISNRWQQVPVQVDERASVDLGQIYTLAPVGLEALCYTDTNTFTGPDPDPTLDADDEVVLMLSDAGEQAPGVPAPMGVVTNSGIEVQVMDPTARNEVADFYLFRRSSELSSGAERQYVSYDFNLLSGDYKTTYRLGRGPNPEDSQVFSSYYTYHFSDRWIDDGLQIFTDATGENLLDRHKTMIAPGDCFRSEDTFCAAEGAFIANKSGPIRGIRSFMGANSGTFTQRDHFFYRRRQDITVHHRVHPIGSTVDFFDYSTHAIGMTNFNNLNPAGLRIDGSPDDFFQMGTLRWELVSGPQGSLVMLHRLDTDIPGLTNIYYYEDSMTPNEVQCTGDDYALGSSGPWLFNLLCTDPTRPECATNSYHLTLYRVMYFLGANSNSVAATALNEKLDAPLFVTANPWPAPVLPAPLKLEAWPGSSNSIELAWTDPSSNESGFRLERRALGAGLWVSLAQTAANTSNYSDRAVSPGGIYQYRIASFNPEGESDFSNLASVTAPGSPLPPRLNALHPGPSLWLEVTTTPGRTTVIEAAVSWPALQWYTLKSFLGDGSPAMAVDPYPPAEQRFYRAFVR